MRSAFVATLQELAKENEKIFVLNADLGFRVWDDFMKAFPSRCVNVGVAEQNMVGIAAGMALEGWKVYIYSIINFLTMRALEQIWVDIAAHNLPVVIVGIGAGFAYSEQGPTHHAIGDMTIMRAMPNMTVVAPGDPVETKLVTRLSLDHQGPIYLRLGKRGDPVVHQNEPHFKIGKAIELCQGNDVTLVACGTMLPTASNVVARLKAKHIYCRLISMHTIKPIDADILIKAAKETGYIITLEEHSILGGLGGAVAEVLAESGVAVPFKRFGIKDTFSSVAGSQEYLRRAHRLTEDTLEDDIYHIMRKSL